MKKIVGCVILCTMLGMSFAGPIIGRSAKTLPGNAMLFQVNMSYTTVSRVWSWTDEVWNDISPDANQTTVLAADFLLGYAPTNKWEVLAHVPVMKKDRDTLSAFGLQDIWLKTRYNFIGGKAKPYITGVAAMRIPTSSEDANPALDDGTLDIGAGLLYFQSFGKVLLHIRTAYWYNMKTDADIDVGDDLEFLIKPEYQFHKKAKFFLAFGLVETFKAKDNDGNEIDNSQKRRTTLSPGLVVVPTPGLSLRPKLIVPLEMMSQGGSNFAWKLGFDVWYLAKL